MNMAVFQENLTDKNSQWARVGLWAMGCQLLSKEVLETKKFTLVNYLSR